MKRDLIANKQRTLVFRTVSPSTGIRNRNNQWGVWTGPSENKVIIRKKPGENHLHHWHLMHLEEIPRGGCSLAFPPSLPSLLFPFHTGQPACFSFYLLQGNFHSYSWGTLLATDSAGECSYGLTCLKILSAARICLVRKSQ